MQVTIELTEVDLKMLVTNEIKKRLGGELEINSSEVKIETKSARNYRSEWETAQFRARISVNR